VINAVTASKIDMPASHLLYSSLDRKDNLMLENSPQEKQMTPEKANNINQRRDRTILMVESQDAQNVYSSENVIPPRKKTELSRMPTPLPIRNNTIKSRGHEEDEDELASEATYRNCLPPRRFTCSSSSMEEEEGYIQQSTPEDIFNREQQNQMNGDIGIAAIRYSRGSSLANDDSEPILSQPPKKQNYILNRTDGHISKLEEKKKESLMKSCIREENENRISQHLIEKMSAGDLEPRLVDSNIYSNPFSQEALVEEQNKPNIRTRARTSIPELKSKYKLPASPTPPPKKRRELSTNEKTIDRFDNKKTAEKFGAHCEKADSYSELMQQKARVRKGLDLITQRLNSMVEKEEQDETATFSFKQIKSKAEKNKLKDTHDVNVDSFSPLTLVKKKRSSDMYPSISSYLCGIDNEIENINHKIESIISFLETSAKETPLSTRKIASKSRNKTPLMKRSRHFTPVCSSARRLFTDSINDKSRLDTSGIETIKVSVKNLSIPKRKSTSKVVIKPRPKETKISTVKKSTTSRKMSNVSMNSSRENSRKRRAVITQPIHNEYMLFQAKRKCRGSKNSELDKIYKRALHLDSYVSRSPVKVSKEHKTPKKIDLQSKLRSLERKIRKRCSPTPRLSPLQFRSRKFPTLNLINN